MAQILTFARKLQPLTVRSGQKHQVAIEIVDTWKPRRTRMILQLAISDAASFRGLAGLTDVAVGNGYIHKFSIGKTALLRRFIAETTDLVSDGLVVIRIDGAVVRPRIRKGA